MSDDPLLTDDLAALLPQFPNEALHGIVGILKQHRSLSPFPAPRAYEAHAAAPEDDLLPHASAIATEILWWGSHDLRRQIGEERDWRMVVADVADNVDVPKKDRCGSQPAWRIEAALFRKVLADWEKLDTAQREKALRNSGITFDAPWVGIATAVGQALRAGGPRLLEFIGRETWAARAAALGGIATVLGAALTVYDLAGPAYRVLRPTVLMIAHTRQCLRDKRAAAAFMD